MAAAGELASLPLGLWDPVFSARALPAVVPAYASPGEFEEIISSINNCEPSLRDKVRLTNRAFLLGVVAVFGFAIIMAGSPAHLRRPRACRSSP